MGVLDTPSAAAVLEQLADLLLRTPHRGKGALVDAAAASLGVSKQSVYARMKARGLQWPKAKLHKGQFVVVSRKRRVDAGTSCLTLEEAHRIAAYISSSDRRTGKTLACIQDALDTLRANGEILAGRLNEETGEFIPMTASAAAKAMRAYQCHPAQLKQPTPKMALSSPHPNYCMQIDPSQCVLFYLRGVKGLQAMPADEFYKNKPQNLARIENERVWRYVFVDHASGAFYVEYVLGAESGLNLCNTFINAMQPRGPGDPFCGVPKMVMLDPGSANTGALFRSLCAALGIHVQINQPKQPWVKGSVEKHNDIIERGFEHRLRFHNVQSLDELNAYAWRWSRNFQSTKEMDRHGMTRFDAWMRITPEQFRLPPSVDVCRRLANHTPKPRTVNVFLRVSYQGKRYDVSHVPNVLVGGKVMVSHCAWEADAVHIAGHDATGREVFYVARSVGRDDFGFEGAAQIGDFRAAPTTHVDTQRSAVERVAMDAKTDDEAAAKRKAKALPFGGRIDPYKSLDEVASPRYLPRRGVANQVEAPVIIEPAPRQPAARPAYVAPLLSHPEMARGIKWRLEARGAAWSIDMYARMAALWPDGATEEALDDCAVQLMRGGLRAVGGGA